MTDVYVRKAKLVRVIDGDTIVADIDLGFDSILVNQVIRLLECHAPEVRGAERPQGLAAKDKLISLLADSAITIRCPDCAIGSFGRWLCYVDATDRQGKNTRLDSAMVAAGHATKIPRPK